MDPIFTFRPKRKPSQTTYAAIGDTVIGKFLHLFWVGLILLGSTKTMA